MKQEQHKLFLSQIIYHIYVIIIFLYKSTSRLIYFGLQIDLFAYAETMLFSNNIAS